MGNIEVYDKVQIIKASADQPDLLNKTGKVVMITDETMCFVQLDGGGSANLEMDRLKKAG